MRGLAGGSRDALLESKNDGSDRDSREVGHGTDQLLASQVVGKSGSHSGTPKHRISITRIRLATPAPSAVEGGG